MTILNPGSYLMKVAKSFVVMFIVNYLCPHNARSVWQLQYSLLQSDSIQFLGRSQPEKKLQVPFRQSGQLPKASQS